MLSAIVANANLYSKLKHKIISPVYPVADNQNSSEADPNPKKYSTHVVFYLGHSN